MLKHRANHHQLTSLSLLAALSYCSIGCEPDLCEDEGTLSAGFHLRHDPRVDFRSRTYKGDLHLDSTEEAQQVQCVRHIRGDLEISGDSAFPSATFPDLESVTGDVSLDYDLHAAVPAAGTDPRIRRIELPSLETIGGGLSLNVDDTGSDTSNDGRNAIGIDALTDVGGTIDILWGIGPGYSPSGLAGLTTHGSDLTMQLFGDQDHGHFLENLANVDGNVTFNTASTDGGILKGLLTVGGNVTLENSCTSGTRSMGPLWFDSLTSIGGDLIFSHSIITEYFGLMHDLEEVQGTVSIEGSAAEDFPVTDQGHTLSVGAVSFVGNPLLSDLNMSHVQVDPAGDITIEDNCVLPATAAQDVVDEQTLLGWSGTALVSNNGTGPGDCSACFPF